MSEGHPVGDGNADSTESGAAQTDGVRREGEAADGAGPGCDHDTLTSPGDRGSSSPGLLPDSFAGYTILREIHRGGQGVVYQALQQGTKRKVAIKAMREGPFAGRHDKARFEREVEILGQLNHPNIVAIHDSGTAGGSFYFVMDYISGRPLDVWIASGKRTIEETLRLFAKICDAVNAAHLRGVIHRDLKPGNIQIDGNGEPHILDFGLAKVATPLISSPLRGDEAGGPVMTITGQFMGSLPWASPEQAEGMPSKIDTRTDVYSLGVVLYQMLTGKFPYEVIGNMRDVLDRIMRAEPARPSTVRKQINDEVETIVLKCLSKERERRYQTAGELARDVGHYLKGEAIEAKRDSALYVLRKQLRRYKVPVAVAALFVIVLSVSTVALYVMYGNQSRERQRTEQQRDRAVAAEEQQSRERERADVERDAAVTARSEAEARRREAELQAYIANISAADTALRAGEIATVGRRLNAAPLELRNWEWRYLNAWSDRSMATLRGHEHEVDSVAFTPDGTRVASGSWDNTVKLWDAASGAEVATLRGHEGSVPSLAFSPDGTRLASGSQDNTVKLWDVASGAEVATLRGHENGVTSVAFSPDGTRLASGSWDKTVKLWETATGNEPLTLRGHTRSVASVAFSPDSTRLATGSEDRTVKLWETATGNELLTLRGQAKGVRSVAFSPDGTRLATGSLDQTVKLWETATGNELLTLRGQAKGVSSVAFSPDGTRLATGSWDKTVKLWDVASGAEVATLRGHEGAVSSVAFSPDGTRLASGSWDRTAKLWDVASGAEVLTLRGHKAPLTSVAFSPDGTRLASGSWDKTVKLWDASSGTELATLPGHEGAVSSVAFSPDGTRLASGSDDKTVMLWDSVPPRIRAAMPAQEMVDALFEQLGTSAKVVLRLRQDASLSPGLRRAADFAVLRRTSEMSTEAIPLVDRLFTELKLCSDVTVRLRGDTSLSKPIREFAIDLVQRRGDDPGRLNGASRSVVSAADKDAQAYRQALRWAEAACKLVSDDGRFLTTLGVAQYRVGVYQDALATLTHSDEINRRASTGLISRVSDIWEALKGDHHVTGGQPADIAFMAMSLHQLGRADEARAALERLRVIMRDPKHAENEESQGFLREAEALLLGAPTSQPVEVEDHPTAP
ncbi:MAG: protein kinase [Planctomycetota bacterium]